MKDIDINDIQIENGLDEEVREDESYLFNYVPEIESPLNPLIDTENDYIVLGRRRSEHQEIGNTGLMDIGVVAETQLSGDNHLARQIMIDNQFPHIIFICGKRGSGKSYTLGTIAEELAKGEQGIGTVLIDPIGIFWSMKRKNRSDKEIEQLRSFGLEARGFHNVDVYTPMGYEDGMEAVIDDNFSIAIHEMSAGDWCTMFDVNRFKAQGLLIGDVINKVREGYIALYGERKVEMPGKDNAYSIGDIIQCIEHDIDFQSKKKGYAVSTRRSMGARFLAAGNWGIFSVDGTPITQLIKANRVTVIDVSHPKLDDDKRALIVGILARKILEGRIQASKREEAISMGLNVSRGESIPVTWLLIDEAHLILPHRKSTPATSALIEYAKLGRRPGCALVLATQRPASTDDEVLSQVDMMLSHNLALKDDIQALKKRIPAKAPNVLMNTDFIRSIPTGMGIIADQKTQQRTLFAKFRPRQSYHSGKAATPQNIVDSRESVSYAPVPESVTPKFKAGGSSVLTPSINVEKMFVHIDSPEEKKEEDTRPVFVVGHAGLEPKMRKALVEDESASKEHGGEILGDEHVNDSLLEDPFPPEFRSEHPEDRKKEQGEIKADDREIQRSGSGIVTFSDLARKSRQRGRVKEIMVEPPEKKDPIIKSGKEKAIEEALEHVSDQDLPQIQKDEEIEEEKVTTEEKAVESVRSYEDIDHLAPSKVFTVEDMMKDGEVDLKELDTPVEEKNEDKSDREEGPADDVDIDDESVQIPEEEEMEGKPEDSIEPGPEEKAEVDVLVEENTPYQEEQADEKETTEVPAEEKPTAPTAVPEKRELDIHSVITQMDLEERNIDDIEGSELLIKALEEGPHFLFKDERGKRAIEFLKDLMDDKQPEEDTEDSEEGEEEDSLQDRKKVLLISRIPRSKVLGEFSKKDVIYYWLSRTPIKNSLDPNDLWNMVGKIAEFLKENSPGFVYINGLEYIMTVKGFKAMIEVVQCIHEIALVLKGVVVFNVMSRVLDEKQLLLLEMEMDKVFDRELIEGTEYETYEIPEKTQTGISAEPGPESEVSLEDASAAEIVSEEEEEDFDDDVGKMDAEGEKAETKDDRSKKKAEAEADLNKAEDKGASSDDSVDWELDSDAAENDDEVDPEAGVHRIEEVLANDELSIKESLKEKVKEVPKWAEEEEGVVIEKDESGVVFKIKEDVLDEKKERFIEEWVEEDGNVDIEENENGITYVIKVDENDEHRDDAGMPAAGYRHFPGGQVRDPNQGMGWPDIRFNQDYLRRTLQGRNIREEDIQKVHLPAPGPSPREEMVARRRPGEPLKRMVKPRKVLDLRPEMESSQRITESEFADKVHREELAAEIARSTELSGTEIPVGRDEPGSITESEPPAREDIYEDYDQPEFDFLAPGSRHLVVEPQITDSRAESSAMSDLETKGLIKKKRIEMVTGSQITFLPLMRLTVSRTEGLIRRKKKNYTLFFDPVTGELVTRYKKGLKRTMNLWHLFGRSVSEIKTLYYLRRSAFLMDTELKLKTSLRAQDLNRALKNLEKEGLVNKEVSGDGGYRYARDIDLNVPSKFTRAVPDLPYIREGDIKTEALKPEYKTNDIKSIIDTLGDGLSLDSEDVVYYPYFIISIKGKRGPRQIFIDAVNGNKDDILSGLTKYQLEDIK